MCFCADGQPNPSKNGIPGFRAAMVGRPSIHELRSHGENLLQNIGHKGPRTRLTPKESGTAHVPGELSVRDAKALFLGFTFDSLFRSLLIHFEPGNITFHSLFFGVLQARPDPFQPVPGLGCRPTLDPQVISEGRTVRPTHHPAKLD